MKTKTIVTLVIILGVLSLVSVLGINSVQANGEGNYPPIVQRLVERFNLDQGEVEQVFDEAREQRRAEMQNRFQERLDQAVTDGQITEEQKQAISAKKAEMQANREEMKDLSFEEIKELRETHRQEMEAWAEENGIDLTIMPMLIGKQGKHGHFGQGMGK